MDRLASRAWAFAEPRPQAFREIGVGRSGTCDADQGVTTLDVRARTSTTGYVDDFHSRQSAPDGRPFVVCIDDLLRTSGVRALPRRRVEHEEIGHARPRVKPRQLTCRLATAQRENSMLRPAAFDDGPGRPNIPPCVMQRDHLFPTLRQLGITDRNCRALKLLPLAYVAWAEGEPPEPRRRYLHELAERHFRVGDEGLALVRWWTYQRPTAEYFAEGLRILRVLAHAPDDWEFDQGELCVLLLLAEAVARTKGHAPGPPTAVTEAEERALAYVGQVLGVENGTSWAALLRELEEPSRAPVSRAA